MKTKIIVGFLLLIVTASQPAFTAVRSKLTDNEPPPVTIASASADNAHVLADLLAISPVIPRGPRDLLRDYELEMAAVQTDSMPSSAGETVLVAMPFSSLQLSPSLVEYVGLTPTQVRYIQRLMDQERPTTEPLMQELRTISEELHAAIQHRQNNDNEGDAKRLAATQARLLKQLMRANSRLQQRFSAAIKTRFPWRVLVPRCLPQVMTSRLKPYSRQTRYRSAEALCHQSPTHL